MPQIDRHKLHFGPYRTPRFNYGAKVAYQARGEGKIVRLTSGRISWPIAKTDGATSPVLYKSLVRAVLMKPALRFSIGAAYAWRRFGSGAGYWSLGAR